MVSSFRYNNIDNSNHPSIIGGTVTSSVSGKTDYLIVGKAPGASKYSQAEIKGIKIISTLDLKLGIESGKEFDQISFETPTVKSFSAGYTGKYIGY